MHFSTVLVALLATSSFAAPAPAPAGAAPAPAPRPQPVKPNTHTQPGDTSQDPTPPDDNTPTDPISETPTAPDETETEPSGTGEPAPETSGTTTHSCSTKRDLSNLFGLLRRGCGEDIVMPPGGQPPKDPADIPPYKAPSKAEMKQYMDDIAAYTFGDVKSELSVRLRKINSRYINRIPGDGDVQLYAGDGKDGAMTQTEIGQRLNVGQAYHDYNQGFFDPAQEPSKSIMKTGDSHVIQNFFASTSADFVMAANMPQNAKAEPTGTVVLSASFSPDQLATMKGGMGFPLIFTSDENPAAQAHPGVRFMTQVDPKVAETFLPDTAPALAVVANPELASADPADLANGWKMGADGKTVYRKMAQGWMPVHVLWDKLGVYGPKSWP